MVLCTFRTPFAPAELSEWRALMRALRFIGNDLTERDCTLCFVWSRMCVIDASTERGMGLLRDLEHEDVTSQLCPLCLQWRRAARSTCSAEPCLHDSSPHTCLPFPTSLVLLASVTSVLCVFCPARENGLPFEGFLEALVRVRVMASTPAPESCPSLCARPMQLLLSHVWFRMKKASSPLRLPSSPSRAFSFGWFD